MTKQLTTNDTKQSMTPAAQKNGHNKAEAKQGIDEPLFKTDLLFDHLAVQPKLTVGKPDDEYEKEADSVADCVMCMPDHAVSSSSNVSQTGTNQDDALSTITSTNDHTIQCRRIPDASDISNLLPGISSPDVAANYEGLRLAIQRQLDDMSPADIAMVESSLLFNPTIVDAMATDDYTNFLDLMLAIQFVNPDSQLGNPADIEVGPRNATETANLSTLVSNTEALIDEVLLPANRVHLEQVFGYTDPTTLDAAHVTTAVNRYTAGKSAMRSIHTADQIITDRSGYSSETYVAGMANSTSIFLDPHVMDNPGDNSSQVTMLHEAMHAGTSSVGDEGYIGTPNFDAMPTTEKLNNAAHYEVAARRLRGMGHSYTGTIFTPASSLPPSAQPTAAENGAQIVNTWFEDSWSNAGDIYLFGFDHIYKNPSDWNTDVEPGVHYSQTLPYWSKVENLTTHNRSVDPADPNNPPVTLIDLALSEGFVRRLGDAAELVPGQDVDILSDETTYLQSSDPEQTALTAAPTDPNAHANALLLIVLRDKLRSLTRSSFHLDDPQTVRVLHAGPMFPNRAPVDFP